MIRKKKAIITTAAVILLAIIGGSLYLNKYYLPKIAKQKIISGLSDFTQGKVELDNIHFNLLRGVVIKGLALYDKDNPQTKLCSVKEISASILILPSFKAKQIIIPSLTIKSASIQLIRQKDNTLNISYLLDKKPSEGSSNNKPLIKSITITDSSVSFTDNTLDPAARIDISGISIHTNVSLSAARVQGSLILSKDEKRTNLVFSAQYIIASKDIKGHLTLGDLDFNTYSSYIDGLNFPLQSAHINQLQCAYEMKGEDIQTQINASLDNVSCEKNGVFLKKAESNIQTSAQTTKNNLKAVTYQGQINILKGNLVIDKTVALNADIASTQADFEGDQNIIRLKSDIKAGQADIKKEDIIVSKADALIQAQINIPFKKDQDQMMSYEGHAIVSAQQISGIPKIGNLNGLTADLSFINQDITINAFTVTALGAELKGKSSFKDKFLSLDAQGTFALNQLTGLAPQSVNLKPYDISGASLISFHMEADLEAEQIPAFTGNAQISDVKVARADKNLVITSPSGQITFDTADQQFSALFEKINYLNEDYYLDAKIKGFPQTSILAKIRDKNTFATLEAFKDGDLITIKSLEGKFIDSDISLKGTIDLTSEMSLSGNIVLELKDLKNILPEQEILKKINPQGKLLIVGQVSGPPKNWRLWSARANAKCRALNIYNFNFNNVDIEYTQIEKDVFLNKLSFNAYDGTGLIQGRFDLSDKIPAYGIRGKIENIDLSLLKNDTVWKDKVFYGTFSSLFSIGGNGFDTESILGEGNIAIENGNIWEFNPLKGLGNFLFNPGFTKISFTHAHGDFSIADNAVSTNNLELLGSDLGLLAEGTISFKGDLDLLVNTQIAPSGPLTDNKGVRIANAVVGGVTTLKIGGTIEKPTYKLQSLEKNIIKTVGNLISNILQ